MTTWYLWAWKTNHFIFSVAGAFSRILGYRSLSCGSQKWEVFGMIYLLRIYRFFAKKPPKRFSRSIFFCHFAKLSIPKTQLCLVATVQYLAGLEIKPVRTVLKSSGIHRLLVSFRAYLMTYNFQTFFLPQYIKLCKVFMSILFNFWKSYFI